MTTGAWSSARPAQRAQWPARPPCPEAGTDDRRDRPSWRILRASPLSASFQASTTLVRSADNSQEMGEIEPSLSRVSAGGDGRACLGVEEVQWTFKCQRDGVPRTAVQTFAKHANDVLPGELGDHLRFVACWLNNHDLRRHCVRSPEAYAFRPDAHDDLRTGTSVRRGRVKRDFESGRGGERRRLTALKAPRD